jgi:hypothetical protein
LKDIGISVTGWQLGHGPAVGQSLSVNMMSGPASQLANLALSNDNNNALLFALVLLACDKISLKSCRHDLLVDNEAHLHFSCPAVAVVGREHQ